MRPRPNRAALRGFLALVIVCVAWWQGCQWNTDAEMSFERALFTSAADSTVACFRIPALEESEGVLLAAIDERVPSCADLRGNRNVNILLRRSDDGGRTWMPAQRIVDLPEGVSVSDPSFIVDEQRDRVFLLANLMDHDRAPGQYRFVITHSDDAGSTWSPLRDITDEVAPSTWVDDFMFVTSGHGTQASDGTLLHTMVNLQRGTFVLLSEDHGLAWKLAASPVIPADESKIVELDDVTWMVNSRVAGAGHRWIHESGDRGQTWSSRPDSSLVDPAVNASLINHPEGLVFVNAHHPTDRTNLELRVSRDEGTTWSGGLVIEPGSAAYASAIVLQDGSVAVFYERADYTENVFRRIPTEELPARD